MHHSLTEPICKTNPIVYLDIKIGQELTGRLIIELRKDVVPKTAENFRALCTGECGIGTLGKPLHYKGIKFHKVTRVFVAQSGDIVNNDGTSGESIYGPLFEDENFVLKHDEGVVSMANYGEPHTNNSQFVITTVRCDHLNDTNVVCGRVLRGLGIIFDMEQVTTNESVPKQDIVISDCGEIKDGESWGFCDNDDTADKLPPYPDDWDNKIKIFTSDEIITILTSIRNAGNYFFTKQRYYEARRKYKKAERYYILLRRRYDWKELDYIKCSDDELKKFNNFSILNHLNLAAVELKLYEFASAKYACDNVLRIDENCSKAYYRRGQAHMELKNYDEAIRDLKRALELVPDSKTILNELNHAKKLLADYNRSQMSALKGLFN